MSEDQLLPFDCDVNIYNDSCLPPWIVREQGVASAENVLIYHYGSVVVGTLSTLGVSWVMAKVLGLKFYVYVLIYWSIPKGIWLVTCIMYWVAILLAALELAMAS